MLAADFFQLPHNCPTEHFIATCCGGRGGIRTHGELAPTLVFKTSSLNHSDTLPYRNFTRFQDCCLKPLGHSSIRFLMPAASERYARRSSSGNKDRPLS